MIPKAYSVGIYARLSKDDGAQGDGTVARGESVSIENQKAILMKHIEEQPGWVLHDTYVDDGWSGGNFNLPEMRRMIQDVQDGAINLVICKDLSRFGRESSDFSRIVEQIFPLYGCRFVALGENVDTIHDHNDIMPIKNLFNEMFLRDTSKKVKAVRRLRAESGKFMGSHAPYGYRKSPSDKHQLIIDEQTAPVVRRIFAMRCAGMGYRTIADALNREYIAPPIATYYSGYENGDTLGNGLWANTAVKRVLLNEAYIGHMVQGKQSKISFKSKKMVDKPQDEWIRVENTHEPIIDRRTWEQVQVINARKHKPRALANGDSNMFVGMLRCADCGQPMRYQSRKFKHGDGSSFLCGTYSRSGKSACTAHIIQERVLIALVLEDIRKNAALVALDEQAVIREIIRQKNSLETSSLARRKQELKHLRSRLTELDKLIQSLYEDRVKGSVPETVFQSLMEKYEAERLDKQDRADLLNQQVSEGDRDWSDVAEWANRIRQYTQLQTLTAETLLELIDRIDIGAATVENNQRICNITVYYRFVADVNLSALNLEVGYGQAV